MTIVNNSEPHKIDFEKVKFKNIDHLISAIGNRKAVVYVGAGVSIAAGLPNWKNFLIKCIRYIKKHYRNVPLKIAEELHKNGDYILSAELLDLETGGRLSEFIENEFSHSIDPSAIHFEITRIPFAFAITTNFDNLLEKAYGQDKKVYTWSNISDFFRQIKNNKFAILKTHGDNSINSSHIITKKNYSNFMRNSEVNSHMLNLLASNTFLFVGSSLRDPDLLKILEDAKNIFGSNFGPHYAILFENEIDDTFLIYLRNFYGIEVIVIKNESSPELNTSNIVSFLRYLSGKSALKHLNINYRLYSNFSTFNFYKIVEKSLKELMLNINCKEATLIIQKSRDNKTLSDYYTVSNIKKRLIFSKGTFKQINRNEHQKDILRKFINISFEHPVYISDTSDFTCYPKIPNYDIDFESLNPSNIRESMLIYQIISEGFSLGLLIIRTNIIDAFTKHHQKAGQIWARTFGSLYLDLELKSQAQFKINLEKNATEMTKLIETSLFLKPLNFNYLFYEIDYRNGQLIAHYDKEKVFTQRNLELPKENKVFKFQFEDKTFATSIFNSSKEDFYSSIDRSKNELFTSREAKNGLDYFNIDGQIFGTPIRIGNFISFILVAWSNNKDFQINNVKDKISRIVNLIANSSFDNGFYFQDSSNFIELVNKSLESMNALPPWKTNLKNLEFRKKLLTNLIRCLIENPCNIYRIRLWCYDKKNKKFVCYYSYSRTSLEDPQLGKIDEFKGLETPETDEYCKYTINRFENNPSSEYQHPTTFKKPDQNNSILNKDPNGKWIVCPIIISKHYVENKKRSKFPKKELLGFISADNHFEKKDLLLTDKQESFQKYALESISDLLAPLVYFINKENFVNSN
jgi:hypothetical protein